MLISVVLKFNVHNQVICIVSAFVHLLVVHLFSYAPSWSYNATNLMLHISFVKLKQSVSD
jgi:hypothetical protein